MYNEIKVKFCRLGAEIVMREFLKKPPVKNIIITAFGTFITIAVAILGNWSPAQSHFLLKLGGFIVLLILYLVIMGIYTRVEVNDRRSAEIRQRQSNTFEDLVMSMISICETNASEINTCIHNVQKTKIIDLKIWSFNKASRSICEHIYNNICNLGDSKKYAVAYVRLIEDGAAEDTVEMIAYANQNRHKPTVFGKRRPFKNIDLDSAYHDLCLFHRAKSDNDIAMGPEEVDKIFVQQKGNSGKRFLYIGIPVFCDNKKMIGLLEIVGLDNSMLSCVSKEELEEVTNKFLVPYANVFLLLHKMERALLVGTNGANGSANTSSTSNTN